MFRTCEDREDTIIFLATDGPEGVDREELEELRDHMRLCGLCQEAYEDYKGINDHLVAPSPDEPDWEEEAEKTFKLVGLEPTRKPDERARDAEKEGEAQRQGERSKAPSAGELERKVSPLAPALTVVPGKEITAPRGKKMLFAGGGLAAAAMFLLLLPVVRLMVQVEEERPLPRFGDIASIQHVDLETAVSADRDQRERLDRIKSDYLPRIEQAKKAHEDATKLEAEYQAAVRSVLRPDQQKLCDDYFKALGTSCGR